MGTLKHLGPLEGGGVKGCTWAYPVALPRRVTTNRSTQLFSCSGMSHPTYRVCGAGGRACPQRLQNPTLAQKRHLQVPFCVGVDVDV